MKNNLEEGQEITINIPFTYTIGEEGYTSGNVLRTVQDCKDEVLSELEAGDISPQMLHMEVVEEKDKPLFDKDTTVWDFISMYYPNYYSSGEVAMCNDLQKLISGEWEEGDCAHELLEKEYHGNPFNPQIEIDLLRLNNKIMETTIQKFIKNKS